MYRTGIGFDAHAFREGRKLVLGGVEFPKERGLDGHSDADVLSHAVADAVLGAAGGGDIGRHFPPSDPECGGISSLVILSRAASIAKEKGFRIENVDCSVVCEKPKVSSRAALMEKTIAGALGISPENVSVKGTSTDGLGFAGRGEGVAAFASALLRKA